MALRQDPNDKNTIPLTSSAKSSSDQLIDGVLLIGVRHDDAVVLGAHVGLYSLAVGGTTGVDVATGIVSA